MSVALKHFEIVPSLRILAIFLSFRPEVVFNFNFTPLTISPLLDDCCANFERNFVCKTELNPWFWLCQVRDYCRKVSGYRYSIFMRWTPILKPVAMLHCDEYLPS